MQDWNWGGEQSWTHAGEDSMGGRVGPHHDYKNVNVEQGTGIRHHWKADVAGDPYWGQQGAGDYTGTGKDRKEWDRQEDIQQPREAPAIQDKIIGYPVQAQPVYSTIDAIRTEARQRGTQLNPNQDKERIR